MIELWICIHKIIEAYPLIVHVELFITELFEGRSHMYVYTQQKF